MTTQRSIENGIPLYDHPASWWWRFFAAVTLFDAFLVWAALRLWALLFR